MDLFAMLAFLLSILCCYTISGKPDKLDGAVGNSYIVEFQPQEVDSVSTVHADFHRHLTETATSGYSTRFEWNNPDVMVGMSVVLNDSSDKDLLALGPGVMHVYPNRIVKRPDDYRGASPRAETEAKLRRRDNSGDNSDFLRLKDTFPSHVLTGVDKLHALQMYGQGQTVGIVDDGISHHPALDSRYGDNKGWAFVGDDYNANNASTMQLRPGPDPFTKCGTHGTHIAGIVAANDTRLGFTGVVPLANLRSYRISGCHGYTTSDLIIAGLERAYSDGNDVISLSWDTGIDAEASPASVVATRINAKGTPVVLAVGNQGYLGMFGADDAAVGATTVGAISNPTQPGYTAQVVGSSPSKHIRFFSAYWVKWNTSSVFEVYNVDHDACKPFEAPDLGNKIVLVSQGTCPLSDLFRNAYTHNAKFVWVYDRLPNNATFDLDAIETSLGGLQTASIPHDDAFWIQAQLQHGKRVSIDFAKAGRAEYPDSWAGNRIVSVSGFGPSVLNNVNPSMMAPGGDILSTYPAEDGSYSVWWGTSMAAPFVAGSYALYRSVHPGSDARLLQNVFASTATPYVNGSESNITGPVYIDTVAKQGAGLVNVARAVFQQVIVDPCFVSMNDTSHFNGTHTITLTNKSPLAKTFKLGHIPAATADAVNATTSVLNDYPVPLYLDPARVEFNAPSVTVPPNGQTTFTAKIVPPHGANAAKIPIYSGFIHLEAADASQSLNVTYVGVAADYTKIDPIDRSNAVLGFELPAFLEADQKTVITTNGHKYGMDKSATWPCMFLRLNFYTPMYRVDLVAPDTTWTDATKFGDIKTLGSVDYSQPEGAGHHANNNLYGGAYWVENIMPVLTPGPPPDDKNVTVVAGDYQFLVRAQRPFTEGILMRDFSTWASPTFSLVAATKSP